MSHDWLVVEPYPSEKYEFVSWDDDIPNIWKNKECSNPPTSHDVSRSHIEYLADPQVQRQLR
jgi:hypothetical protein